MLKLRINPIVAKDLKNIRDYIAEDNEEYAAKTIKEIYGKFENLQMFPGMGLDLSKRVSFRTDYKFNQPSPSFTASSASCSFKRSFFSARSRS